MLWRVAVLCVTTGRVLVLRSVWFMYMCGPVVRPAGWGGVLAFRLGGCGSRFSGARGCRGAEGGCCCASLECDRPVFPSPCAACWRLAGITLLWPVAVCAGGLLRAWGKGVWSGSSGPVTCALAGGGVVALSGLWWSPPLRLCCVFLRVRLTASAWRVAVLQWFVPVAVSPLLLG